MCPPETLASMRSPEISRRNLLKFGLGAAVAAALPIGSAQAATVRRTTFRHVLDLTHVLGTQFLLFPGAAPFRIQQAVSHDKDGYYGSILTYWERSGTHMDAPGAFCAEWVVC